MYPHYERGRRREDFNQRGRQQRYVNMRVLERVHERRQRSTGFRQPRIALRVEQDFLLC